MKYKVLLTEEIDEIGKELLHNHIYEVKTGSGIEEDIIIQEAKDCDAILTRNAKITRRILLSCPRLKVISMHGVGVNNIDIDSATQLGIQVTNAATSNQSSVAEYTMGLVLALAKQTFLYDRELKNGNWDIRKICGMDIEGKTLGIIGMGRIGSAVAKKAALGFGMKVIGYNRHVTMPVKEDYVTLTGHMEDVIRTCDFLSLHLPATPSTEHLIGDIELSWMKPSSYLINTGRGEVIDETALIKVLEEKKIAGAAIDVYDGNIPAMDNPLLHMPHVITTPHTAAFTKQALERMAYQSALGIVESLEGKYITYPVNHLDMNYDQPKIS